jgi:hypothetical protein
MGVLRAVPFVHGLFRLVGGTVAQRIELEAQLLAEQSARTQKDRA